MRKGFKQFMLRRNLRHHALMLAAVATPQLAAAQAPAAPAPPPPRAEGSAEASFVGTTGNSSTQSIGVGATLTWRPSNWENRFKAAYVRNASDSVVSAQALTFSGRGQRPFAARASLFAQYAFLRDRFAGIDARHTAEGGLAGTLVKKPKHTLTADLGGGYADEHRLAAADVSTAIAGAGTLWVWKTSATSDFTEEARGVAAVPNGGDWRYTNTAALAAKVNTRLSLKVSNTIRYVNQPVPGFNDTDVITSVAIVAKF